MYAFEQLIINTEDPNAEESYDVQEDHSELLKIKQQIEDEKDPYMKEQLRELYE